MYVTASNQYKVKTTSSGFLSSKLLTALLSVTQAALPTSDMGTSNRLQIVFDICLLERKVYLESHVWFVTPEANFPASATAETNAPAGQRDMW
jgi:hypothetical protein